MPVLVRTLFNLLLIAALSACATPSSQVPRHMITPLPDCCRTTTADARQQAIVRTAANLVGAKAIESQGRRINYDCAGVARAIYLAHGIDLYEGSAAEGPSNGVGLIYSHVLKHGRLHRGPTVQAGDLVMLEPYPGETLTVRAMYQQYYRNDLTEAEVRRQLAAPIANRARQELEEKLALL